ncbi:MAG: hypothetical protein KGL39_21525 [Patescibacteria group bacterium]|nr:hypothetical protein [Patescibacteria group bacterium]
MSFATTPDRSADNGDMTSRVSLLRALRRTLGIASMGVAIGEPNRVKLASQLAQECDPQDMRETRKALEMARTNHGVISEQVAFTSVVEIRRMLSLLQAPRHDEGDTPAPSPSMS